MLYLFIKSEKQLDILEFGDVGFSFWTSIYTISETKTNSKQQTETK